MNRFVETRASTGRTPTPPIGQAGNNVRKDRLPAQDLKFVKKSGNTAPANTDHAPAYISNHFGDRNTFTLDRQAEYGQDIEGYQNEARQQKDTLEETTVASDFDRTKSDIGFDPADYDEYNDGGFSDEDVTYMHNRPHVEHVGSKEVHTIQYKQSRSPLVNKSGHHTQRQQPLAVAGRFEANKHQDLQLRNGNGDSDHYRQQGSRKRSRSRDAPRAAVTRGLGQEMFNDDDLEEEGGLELPGSQPEVTVRLHSNQIDSDSTEHATPVPSPIRHRKSRMMMQASSPQNLPDPGNSQPQNHLNADDRLNPDFSDEQLERMKYSDLEEESWDTVPRVPNAESYKLPDELTGRKVNLEKKIVYYLKMDAETEQLPFYENLTTTEWDEAGDLFMNKFAELMKKLKAKKQEKRDAASKFEEEVKRREKAVRDHSDKLDQQLEGMQAAGKSLLGGGKKKKNRV